MKKNGKFSCDAESLGVSYFVVNVTAKDQHGRVHSADFIVPAHSETQAAEIARSRAKMRIDAAGAVRWTWLHGTI